MSEDSTNMLAYLAKSGGVSRSHSRSRQLCKLTTRLSKFCKKDYDQTKRFTKEPC